MKRGRPPLQELAPDLREKVRSLVRSSGVVVASAETGVGIGTLYNIVNGKNCDTIRRWRLERYFESRAPDRPIPAERRSAQTVAQVAGDHLLFAVSENAEEIWELAEVRARALGICGRAEIIAAAGPSLPEIYRWATKPLDILGGDP